MRNKHFEALKWTFGVATTVTTLLAASAWLNQNPTTLASRAPASIPEAVIEKHRVYANAAHEGHRHLSKPSSTVDIEIKSKGELSPGGFLELEATIVAQQNIEDMQFAWMLPKDGLSPISGQLDGRLNKMQAGESTTLTLNVRTDTVENRHVHLHVFRLADGEALGRMAQYSTSPQKPDVPSSALKAESYGTMKTSSDAEVPPKIMQ